MAAASTGLMASAVLACVMRWVAAAMTVALGLRAETGDAGSEQGWRCVCLQSFAGWIFRRYADDLERIVPFDRDVASIWRYDQLFAHLVAADHRHRGGAVAPGEVCPASLNGVCRPCRRGVDAAVAHHWCRRHPPR